MFAPPDPSHPAAPHPGPASGATSAETIVPTLPVLPPTTTPVSTPLLPAATVAAPQPVSLPDQSEYAPRLDVVQSIVRPPQVIPPTGTPDDRNVDSLSAEPARPDVRPAPPAPLLRTSWLRRVVIWANVASIPGALAGDLIGASLTLVSLVALIVWSGVIATNVRRARRETRHGRAPHPLAVVLSWLIAPVVGGVALLAILAVRDWATAGTFDEEGGRSMALVATVIAAGLVVLVAAYWPYRVLAKCAKWVNADAGRFRRWFAAPIIAALVAAVVQVMSGLVVLSNSADGSSGSATIAAVGLWVLSFTLPWLAWLIFGNRAMRALESGVAHAHGRAVREACDPAQVDPMLAGGMAAASVGVRAVSAPSA